MPETLMNVVHEQVSLSLYTVEIAPYSSLRIVGKNYPHWILSYVLEGAVATETCGERWSVRSGDLMLHPPDLPFSECTDGAGIHQWMMLDFTVTPDVDFFRLYPIAPVVRLPSDAGYSHLFRQLAQVWAMPANRMRNLRSSALALQLCSIVLECWQQQGSVARPPALMTAQDRFVGVITYMSEHLDQKIMREDLAELVHLHPNYFDRAFQQIYGQLPMQMLRKLRLQRSQYLLESTDMPLSAIASACGLFDASYFSRVFRLYFGQTPGQYRERVKNTTRSYLSPL